MKLKSVVNHFQLITKHKWIVFKLCFRAGIPWRGIVHDLSKYSPTEFWESAKYYTGVNSPIHSCRNQKGYSEAWLHHKGRNKHHPEYWYDKDAPDSTPIMPYTYAVEMVCDTLAAGIIYSAKEWKTSRQLEYWNTYRDRILLNEKIKLFLDMVYIQVSKEGINKTITKQNLKVLYKEYIMDR